MGEQGGHLEACCLACLLGWVASSLYGLYAPKMNSVPGWRLLSADIF